jgi:acetyl-CoA acetyltransferase
MKFLQDRSISIIGYGETPIMKNSGRTALELGAQVVRDILGRAGLERHQVDGVALTTPLSEAGDPFWSNLLVETLGFSPTWLQTTDLGGATAVGSVARAAAAIHAGLCEVVLCVFADAPSTQYLGRQSGHRLEMADPAGWGGPFTGFGLLGSVYSERYGWPEEALAKLAVTQRSAALFNPNAYESLRVPLTRQEYLQSRRIADPLRLLDCVMRCDGANAVLVTSTETAKRLGARQWVHPVAYRELTNPDPTQSSDDLLLSGFSTVGPEALADAGLHAADIRMLQAYDDFLIAVLLQLEEIGFCERGASGKFVMDRSIGHDGNFPINTGGGQISAGQCGLAGGGTVLVEAVRQMFGEAGARQVRDRRNAMVTGLGVLPYAGNWGTSSVLILEER